MANHKSAIKQHKQDLRRRASNRLNRARMRTTVKQFRKALETGDVDSARTMLNPMLSLIDRTSKLGGIHDNAAARTKSRLTRALAKAAS